MFLYFDDSKDAAVNSPGAGIQRPAGALDSALVPDGLLTQRPE